MKRVWARRLAAIALPVAFVACGTAEPPAPPPAAITVTLAPDAATIYVRQTVQFIATVRNSANGAVNWSVSGAGCSGASCGTISSAGLYTAPPSVPAPTLAVTVMAVSAADGTKSASATVTIVDRPVTIALAPDTAYVYTGESVKFAAQVQYAADDAVEWSLSGEGCGGAACGTISIAGLYTAPPAVPSPGVVTVEAVLVADRTRSASARITILEPVSDEWVWLSGGNATSQAGVYGTRGVASPLNVPASRENSVSWADPDGRLWLFGGSSAWPYHQGIYGDLWRFDPATREWTWVSGSEDLDQPGSYGTKGLADPSNAPSCREFASSWAGPGGTLWLFGGYSYNPYNGNFGELNDLWRFEPATGLWTWMSGNNGFRWPGLYGTKGVSDPANRIGARQQAVSWTDPAGYLWLFGGQGYDSANQFGWLNDLWRYDIATDQWTWVSGSDRSSQTGIYGTLGLPHPDNVPGGRFRGVTWIDAQGRLWMFGGFGHDAAGLTGALNDLWRFDPATLEWTWIAGTDLRRQPGVYGTKGVADPANMPGARSRAVSWRDPDGRLWLFGGYGYDSTGIESDLNDLWRFDAVTLQWTWISGSDRGVFQYGTYGTKGMAEPVNVPGSRQGAVSWVDLLGNLWLFGGDGLAEFSVNGQLNDLWKYIR